MAGPRLRRASRIAFGERGDVLFDGEMKVVSASAFLAVSGIFLVSPILSDLAAVFEVSDGEIGLLMTAYTAPSIVLSPVFGLLTDRLGRKPILVGGLLTFGLAGAAIAFVPTFLPALALRFLQGVGFAAVMLVGVALLGDHYRGTEEITAQGIRYAAIQIATLGFPLLAGALLLRSWRLPFLLFGGAVAAGAWAWWALPESETTADAAVVAYVRDLVSLLGDTVLVIVLITFALRFLLTFGFFTYISVLFRDMTASPAVVSGIAVALFGLVSLFAGSQIGRFAASIQPMMLLVTGFVVGTVGMIAMGLAASTWQVFAGVIVFAVGTAVAGPVQKSFVNRLAAQELRGGAVSGSMLFQNLGQSFGPIVFGALFVLFSPGVAFVVVSVVVGGLGVAGSWIGYVLLERRDDWPRAVDG